MTARPRRTRRSTDAAEATERWLALEKDLAGMYRLQSMQLALIRKLQQELEDLRSSAQRQADAARP